MADTPMQRPSERLDPHADLRHRLTNHAPSSPAIGALLDQVTDEMIGMGDFILEHTPPGREQSLALTNLEQVSMWVKAAIARNQDRLTP